MRVRERKSVIAQERPMGASSCILRNLIEELAPMGRSYGGSH